MFSQGSRTEYCIQDNFQVSPLHGYAEKALATRDDSGGAIQYRENGDLQQGRMFRDVSLKGLHDPKSFLEQGLKFHPEFHLFDVNPN